MFIFLNYASCKSQEEQRIPYWIHKIYFPITQIPSSIFVILLMQQLLIKCIAPHVLGAFSDDWNILGTALFFLIFITLVVLGIWFSSSSSSSSLSSGSLFIILHNAYLRWFSQLTTTGHLLKYSPGRNVPQFFMSKIFHIKYGLCL